LEVGPERFVSDGEELRPVIESIVTVLSGVSASTGSPAFVEDDNLEAGELKCAGGHEAR
jgi:hypothetical protein